MKSGSVLSVMEKWSRVAYGLEVICLSDSPILKASGFEGDRERSMLSHAKSVGTRSFTQRNQKRRIRHEQD